MHVMPGLGCSWRLCRIYKYMTSCISEVYIVRVGCSFYMYWLCEHYGVNCNTQFFCGIGTSFQITCIALCVSEQITGPNL